MMVKPAEGNRRKEGKKEKLQVTTTRKGILEGEIHKKETRRHGIKKERRYNKQRKQCGESKDAKSSMCLKMHGERKRQSINACENQKEDRGDEPYQYAGTSSTCSVLHQPGEDPWYFLIKSLNLACPNANSAGFLGLLLVSSTMATCGDPS